MVKRFNIGMDTIIGSKSTVSGDVTSEKSVKIEGIVNGDINVKGDVYIGKKSKIKGDIYANNIEISGHILGNVTAKGLLRLVSKAVLEGDIVCSSFVADEGAMFTGSCTMKDQPNKKIENKKQNLKNSNSK